MVRNQKRDILNYYDNIRMQFTDKLCIMVLALISPLAVHAQQSIVYSQYLFNGLVINPAYAGSHVQLSSTITYRNQWVNFEGSPVTTTFGIHSSVRNGKVGLGILATNDQIGSYRNTGFFGSYAYRIRNPHNGSVLSLGLQAGFNNYTANFEDLMLKSKLDPKFNVFMSEFIPNFGGGILYSSKKMFAGFSVPTILRNTEFRSSLDQLKVPRFYFLQAGANLTVDRQKQFVLHPSFLLRLQDGTPLSIDLNLNLVFNELISLGCSYRTGDGMISFINYKLSEKFLVGYSYDWTISNIGSYSRGTHEIMLNFRTRIRGLHKNVECPQFWSR